MYGCEFCVMDKKTYTEYCSLTGEPTNEAVMCDFEFERCTLRKEAQNQEQQDAPETTSEIIQTSLFGADGEKPFKKK